MPRKASPPCLRIIKSRHHFSGPVRLLLVRRLDKRGSDNTQLHTVELGGNLLFLKNCSVYRKSYLSVAITALVIEAFIRSPAMTDGGAFGCTAPHDGQYRLLEGGVLVWIAAHMVIGGSQ